MNKNYDWLITLIKIVGSGMPGSAPFLQALSEVESKEIKERLSKLEDPISNLHPDIPALAQLIYDKLKLENSTGLEFNDKFYQEYSKSLAVLEANNYIKQKKTLGQRYPSGIYVADPFFIMYLCSIAEDEKKMDSLIELVENCEFGKWLDGKKIQLDLPLPVIRAVFKIYESKGYGICSNETGTCKYLCKS
ncbi:MAG TPA: hypothetical protein VE868_10760 [Balneolaceae bacterium]|nr:hypothetical protein [Balneolaceae bacterium]